MGSNSTDGNADITSGWPTGGFHDLLNDLDKRQVMQDIEDWIDIRLPAALETPAQVIAASLQERLLA